MSCGQGSSAEAGARHLELDQLGQGFKFMVLPERIEIALSF
jgi:hypothetical protein